MAIFLDQHESALFDRFVSWPYFAIYRVCVSGNEYNRKEEWTCWRKKSESCDGKYGKLWYSCYSDIRGSISFISLRIYVLVRFATFSAFFCILWLHIIYIYMYILLYILIAYNFNLYTYMIFIILDLSSLYFSYCKHGSLSLSDYLINIILGKEIRLLNNSIAMLCDSICNIVCCSIIYRIAMI